MPMNGSREVIDDKIKHCSKIKMVMYKFKFVNLLMMSFNLYNITPDILMQV